MGRGTVFAITEDMCIDPSSQLLPVVLIVDSDLESRRRSAQTLRPHAITRPAPDVERARALMRSAPIAGVVLDLVLDQGGGIALLEELRAKHGKLPVLVLSGTEEVTDASRASALRAAFASKREPVAQIQRRLIDLASAAAAYRHSRDGLVLSLAERHALTQAERETLVQFVRRGQRDGLAHQLRIAETSLRSRVRGLCRKLDIPRLESVYRLLFEDALHV